MVRGGIWKGASSAVIKGGVTGAEGSNRISAQILFSISVSYKGSWLKGSQLSEPGSDPQIASLFRYFVSDGQSGRRLVIWDVIKVVVQGYPHSPENATLCAFATPPIYKHLDLAASLTNVPIGSKACQLERDEGDDPGISS